MSALAVELEGVTKRYPGVLANDAVDFAATEGEVHALVGENGAGKTTLMRILAGLVRPDAGSLRIRDREFRPASAADGAAAGVGMVHQHFTLVPAFTVLENVVLGDEPSGWGRFQSARRELEELAEGVGFVIDPDARVGDLTVGERQKVEILRTLSRGAQILVLDEPTAVLTPGETEDLIRVVRRLADEGRTIVFISHRLPEVLAVSDRITVMRRGRTVATVRASEADEAGLARLMVGRDVLLPGARSRDGTATGEPALEVVGLEAESDRGVPALRGIDLTVRGSEVLGIAGVAGNGQAELEETILGIRRASAGRVRIRGRDVTGLSVGGRMRAGLAAVPEDRLDQGLVTDMSAAENLALGMPGSAEIWRGPLLDVAALRRVADAAVADMDVRPPDASLPVSAFSGGNQQKVLLARALSTGARVLLFAEPTRGLDVGAIERVHDAIRASRDDGAAVLLISSDLAELLALSDRIVVMSRGAIVGDVLPGRTSEEELGLMMSGGDR